MYTAVVEKYIRYLSDQRVVDTTDRIIWRWFSYQIAKMFESELTEWFWLYLEV